MNDAVAFLFHLLTLISSADAAFGSVKRKKMAEAAAAAATAAAEGEGADASSTVALFEKSVAFLEKLLAKILSFDVVGVAEAMREMFAEINPVVAAFAAIVGLYMLGRMGKKKAKARTVDVVVVGCGVPKRGMGWYHLTQLLEMKNVRVVGVVEPFFLSGLCKNVPPSFSALVDDLRSKGIKCADSVKGLGLPLHHRRTVCLIAGRTSDNPQLFEDCVDAGACCVFLEKPGAPTVKELERMKALASSRYVDVYLGYNKNITPYVRKALNFAATAGENAHVTFCHNNSYKENELSECFTRNAEGMLKNMAVHELALLVTFFGVTTETIDKFEVETDRKISQKLTLPHLTEKGQKVTDFARVGFKATTKNGTSVSVRADRCGGNVSYAAVLDGAGGKELARFEFPGKGQMEAFDIKCAADPEMMPYFFLQSDDYLELKTRVVDAVRTRGVAQDVATIDIAIEALKLAEYGTKELLKKL